MERHEVGIFRGQYASGYNGGKACEEQSWQRGYKGAAGNLCDI